MTPFLSIIIPAHNEEHRLPNSLGQVFAFLGAQPYTSEVLVVENGSQDQTAQVVKELIPENPTLRLLQEIRRGKGLAVKRGMLEAKGDYRFLCDADLSMPIQEVNRFLPPRLDDYDIAIGSREVAGAIRYHEPLYRHWVGRVFNLLVRVLAVPGFQDTQCGFKCFRAAVAEDLFSIQQLGGLGFDVEVLFLALKRGYRVVEVAIPWYFDPDSRVRMFRDSLAMFRDILWIKRSWRRGGYGTQDKSTTRANPEA
ncbi:MAG: glycosyltransferase family 2 protein [Anaerolineales bacterium]|jgi:glycosyltransferase involved in cell wall biosynthesis